MIRIIIQHMMIDDKHLLRMIRQNLEIPKPVSTVQITNDRKRILPVRRHMNNLRKPWHIRKLRAPLHEVNIDPLLRKIRPHIIINTKRRPMTIAIRIRVPEHADRRRLSDHIQKCFLCIRHLHAPFTASSNAYTSLSSDTCFAASSSSTFRIRASIFAPYSIEWSGIN